MIKSIKFKPEHYATKLKYVGEKKYVFSPRPGLTFLYGPNGSGKSTILKGLARGSSILEKGGWSMAIEPLGYRGDKYNPEAVLKKDADVDWDGSPSFLLDSAVSDNTGAAIELEDGVGDAFMSGILKATSRNSSGEWRINRIAGLIGAIQKSSMPDLTSPMWKTSNEEWQKAGKAHAKYVKTLDRTGVVTLLLDEPDRSLSLPKSRELIIDLLPKMAKDLQIIVATHSIFALFVEGAEVIDLKEGYAEEVKKAVAGLFKGAR